MPIISKLTGFILLVIGILYVVNRDQLLDSTFAKRAAIKSVIGLGLMFLGLYLIQN